MKRTLMMLVAVLAMAAVASVQAADVKVNLQNRGADQQMVSAQNVKYSIANADGEIVAEGEGSEINLDLPEGNYEITVEQTTADGKVHYGTKMIEVTPEGANVAYEITPNGLEAVGPQAPKAIVRSTIPRQPLTNPNLPPQLPQLPPAPQPNAPGVGAMGNWGMLGMIGAIIATSIALGVDDDPAPGVTPLQY